MPKNENLTLQTSCPKIKTCEVFNGAGILYGSCLAEHFCYRLVLGRLVWPILHGMIFPADCWIPLRTGTKNRPCRLGWKVQVRIQNPMRQPPEKFPCLLGIMINSLKRTVVHRKFLLRAALFQGVLAWTRQSPKGLCFRKAVRVLLPWLSMTVWNRGLLQKERAFDLANNRYRFC